MKRAILLLTLFISVGIISSCNKDEIKDLKGKYTDLDAKLKQQQEDLKTYKALLDALNLKVSVNEIEQTTDGYVIKLSDGQQLVVKNGINGQAPVVTIGNNGNWFVDGNDTGKKAEAASPEITIGANGNWLINGVDTGKPAKGADGVSAPKITNVIHAGEEIIFLFDNGEQMKIPFYATPNVTQPMETVGVYMLCEGLMGDNNSEITYYNISTKVAERAYFKKINGYALGETANDLKRYGNKMYCVVSGIQGKKNSYLEVIDVSTGKSLKRIPFFDATTEFMPRYVAFHKNKAYVSSYDGKITRIDTASLKIELRTSVGGALEGLAISNNKLYVTNSDHPFHSGSKNTVTVVDIPSLTKMYDVEVGYNPVKIAATGNGDLLVVSWGNYGNLPAVLTRINSKTDDVVKSYPYSVGPFAVSGNTAYLTLDWGSSFKALDLTTDVLSSNFVTDGTSFSTAYGVTINPQNNDVYLADANGYGSNGNVFCFDKNGKKKFEFATAGLPQHAVFVYSYK